MAPGKLHFRPLTCKFHFEKSKLSSIKPICRISVGSHSRKTGPASIIDEYVSWNHELIFERNSETTMHIEIMDLKEDSTMDLLGFGEFFFDPTLGGENFISDWINLRDKCGHKVGTVLMELTYFPTKHVAEENLMEGKYQQNNFAKMVIKTSRPLGDAQNVLDELPEDVRDENLMYKDELISPASSE